MDLTERSVCPGAPNRRADDLSNTVEKHALLTRGMGAPDHRDGIGADGREVVDIPAEVVNNLP